MGKFAADIRKFAASANESMERTVRRAEIDIYSRIILRSPVDTGRFRGNWNVNTRTITQETDKSGTKTIGEGTAKILSQEGFRVTSFINNLPYAERLEYGHSKQAPQGMVRVTALELGSIVDDAVRGS